MNLESIKVGDTLILKGQHPEDSREVQVARLTKTQVMVGGNRFRKSNGQLVGGSYWDSPSLTIPRKGEIEKIQEARLHHQLVLEINNACLNSQLRAMPMEKLQQLSAFLETLKEKPNDATREIRPGPQGAFQVTD